MTTNVNISVNQFRGLEQPTRDYLSEIKRLNGDLYNFKAEIAWLLFDCHAYFLPYSELCKLIEKDEFGVVTLSEIKYLHNLFCSNRLDTLGVIASELMSYKNLLHTLYKAHFHPIIESIEKGGVK